MEKQYLENALEDMRRDKTTPREIRIAAGQIIIWIRENKTLEGKWCGFPGVDV